MPSQKMERFTQRARRTLSFAHEEAMHQRRTYIGPEHLLVRLMREEGGIGARVLHDLGLETQRVEERVTTMTRADLKPINFTMPMNSISVGSQPGKPCGDRKANKS